MDGGWCLWGFVFVFFKPWNKSIWLRRQFPGTLSLGSIMKCLNPFSPSVKLRFFGRKLFVWRCFPGALRATLPWGVFHPLPSPPQSCVAVIHPQQDRAVCPSSPCMMWDCDTHQTHGWEQAWVSPCSVGPGHPSDPEMGSWLGGEPGWVGERLWALWSHHCDPIRSTASTV